MTISFKKRILLETITSKECPNCSKYFTEKDNFCRCCGSKLNLRQIKLYANIGKKGITSYSYVLPGGQTINSKGKISFHVGNGISFTEKI